MSMSWKSLGLIGLLGGLGGAINVWLCYVKLPGVPPYFTGFKSHIMLAGMAHGALLALIPVTSAWLLRSKRWWVNMLAIPIVGWVSGWLSFIPFDAYFGRSFHLVTLVWPFFRPLWTPYAYFGLVGGLYYLLLNIERLLSGNAILRHMFWGSFGGFLGSLGWWAFFKPWWFSLIHGTIWGSLVGFGVWKASVRGQGAQTKSTKFAIGV